MQKLSEIKAAEMLKARLTCIELELLSCIGKGCDSNCEYCEYNYKQGNMGEQKETLAIAIQALEEIQQYRAIGTIEELRADKAQMMLKKYGSFSEMIDAVAAYSVIGTVEKCREAVERMKPKKPVMRYGCIYRCPPDCGGKEFDEYGDVPHCPSCDRVLHSLDDICKCGQRIAK